MIHIPSSPRIKFPPLPFATRTGNLIFVWGISGFDAGGEIPTSGQVNVLLTRASDVAHLNRLYAEAFGPAPYPAGTTCVVVALPDPKMLIEIEAVAALAG